MDHQAPDYSIAEFDPLETFLHLNEFSVYLIIDSVPTPSITDLQKHLDHVILSPFTACQIGSMYCHLVSLQKGVEARPIADTLSSFGFPSARINSVSSCFEVLIVLKFLRHYLIGYLTEFKQILTPSIDSYLPLWCVLYRLHGKDFEFSQVHPLLRNL